MWPFTSKPKQPFFDEYEALAIEIYNKYSTAKVSSGRDMGAKAAQMFFLKEIKELREKK